MQVLAAIASDVATHSTVEAGNIFSARIVISPVAILVGISLIVEAVPSCDSDLLACSRASQICL